MEISVFFKSIPCISSVAPTPLLTTGELFNERLFKNNTSSLLLKRLFTAGTFWSVQSSLEQYHMEKSAKAEIIHDLRLII